MHALIRTINTDLGFRAENVVIFDLPVARGRLTTPRRLRRSTGRCSTGSQRFPAWPRPRLDRPADRRHSLWRRLRHCRPSRAERRRPARRRHQHGHACLLRDVGHSDPSWPGVHGTGPGRSGRVAIVNDDSSADPSRLSRWASASDGELEQRHGGWRVRERSSGRSSVDGKVMNGGPGRDPFLKMDLPFWQCIGVPPSPFARQVTARRSTRASRPSSRNSTRSCRWPTCGRWSR